MSRQKPKTFGERPATVNGPESAVTPDRDAELAFLNARVSALELLLVGKFSGDQRGDNWVPLKTAAIKFPYSTLQRWVADGRIACRRRSGRIFVNLREINEIFV